MSEFRLKYGCAEIPLNEGELQIGRGLSVDLRLLSDSVSRHHATFRRRGTRVEVFDHGSKNGVSVDGRAVEGWVEVPAGAQVMIGVHALQMVRGALMTKPRARVDGANDLTHFVAQKRRLARAQAEKDGPAGQLSPRERTVLSRFAEGATQQKIATELGVSVKTVETYFRRIRQKSGARSRAQLLELVAAYPEWVKSAV